MTSEIENTKAAAAHYASYYGDLRRHLSTEFASETKWSIASLFALNAGGLVALSGMSLAEGGKLIPASLFWMGIFCAFAHVRYSLWKTKEFVAAISALEEQYVLSSVTGELDHTVIARLEKQKAAVTTKLSFLISIFSFGGFTGALFAIGFVS